MGSELYIGAPNGIVLCVDGIDRGGCYGTFYHAYRNDGVKFSSLGEMLFRMESFFDKIDYPRRGNTPRNFTGETGYTTIEKREKIMSDKELLGRHGEQETFIIRVQHRQNSTWQGRITWADKNKTLTFRSLWEMVHLMENALYEDAKPEDTPSYQSWDNTGVKEE